MSKWFWHISCESIADKGSHIAFLKSTACLLFAIVVFRQFTSNTLFEVCWWAKIFLWLFYCFDYSTWSVEWNNIYTLTYMTGKNNGNLLFGSTTRLSQKECHLWQSTSYMVDSDDDRRQCEAFWELSGGNPVGILETMW